MIQRTPILSLLDHPTTDGFNEQLAQDTGIVQVEREKINSKVVGGHIDITWTVGVCYHTTTSNLISVELYQRSGTASHTTSYTLAACKTQKTAGQFPRICPEPWNSSSDIFTGSLLIFIGP